MSPEEILENFGDPVPAGSRFEVVFRFLGSGLFSESSMRSLSEYAASLVPGFRLLAVSFPTRAGVQLVSWVVVRESEPRGLVLPKSGAGGAGVVSGKSPGFFAALGPWLLRVLPWVASVIGLIEVRRIADDVVEAPAAFSGIALMAVVAFGLFVFRGKF